MDIKKSLLTLKRNIFKTGSERVFKEWFKKDGDITYLMDYPLNEKSMVFDVGGYKGQWTSDIFSRFLSNTYLFEPVKEFAEFSRRRFKKNKKIKVIELGLSDKTTRIDIALNGDESSVFSDSSKEKESIKLKDIKDFLDENKIKRVDLISINIEGGEYNLLKRMIESGDIDKFQNIQIQFHRIGGNYIREREWIQGELSRTHKQKYCFPFVWEAWTRK